MCLAMETTGGIHRAKMASSTNKPQWYVLNEAPRTTDKQKTHMDMMKLTWFRKQMLAPSPSSRFPRLRKQASERQGVTYNSWGQNQLIVLKVTPAER